MKCAREFAYYKSTGELECDIKDYVHEKDYISNTDSCTKETRLYSKTCIYYGEIMIKKAKKMPKSTFKLLTLRNRYKHKGMKLKQKHQKLLLNAQLKRLNNKLAICKHNQLIIEELEDSLKPGTGSLYLEAKMHFEDLCAFRNQQTNLLPNYMKLL